jgi:hypothetical protein
MKKWLFNPFTYVAGGQALGIGMLVMAITSVVGFYSHAHFDGVLHMSPGVPSPFMIFAIEQLVCWLCVLLTFYAGGKFFSTSSIRLIDVAGTTALARWPAIMLVTLGFWINVPHTTLPQELLESLTVTTIVSLLLSIVFVVWMVALFYNAFRVSCNMKGGKGVAVFVVALLVADALSRIILFQVYKLNI